MRESLRPESLTLTQLAGAGDGARAVLASHGLPYCCDGGRALADVCGERQLDAASVLDEFTVQGLYPAPLGTELPRAGVQTHAAAARTLEFILRYYHQPLAEALERLEEMARTLVEVHGDGPAACLPGALAMTRSLRADLEAHMAAEAGELFSALTQAGAVGLSDALSRMDWEHRRLIGQCSALVEATSGLEQAMEACATWESYRQNLQALERTLVEVVQLEQTALLRDVFAGEMARGHPGRP